MKILQSYKRNPKKHDPKIVMVKYLEFIDQNKI